jgi:hypothetical protein
MAVQELIDYIKNAEKEGREKEQIKSALLGIGWGEAEIEEGFKSVGPPSKSYFNASGDERSKTAAIERLQKQKIILGLSITVYLVFLIFSSPSIKPVFKFEAMATIGLVASCLWILGYGLRHIYLVVRLKSFNLSFFVLVFFWLLAIAPLFFAVLS